MFLMIGIAAGALTGVPIGPVNVAVIDAAYRHTFKRAVSTGFGGASADSLYAALGVFIGSFSWFTLVAYLTGKGKNVLGDKAAWIPRIVGICLMVYAVYLLARAFRYVVV